MHVAKVVSGSKIMRWHVFDPLMSPTERLRQLIAPERSRWKPMLLGLAFFAATAEAAVLFHLPDIIAAVLVVLGLAAWIVGACSMVGYVRWFFATELAQSKRDGSDTADRE